jgi:MFS family permease
MLRRVEYGELMLLFFIQGAALGMWFVPLSTVLDAHGLSSIKAFAYAASALAAFVSPLIFGAMADHTLSPVLVLRGLSLATAASMTLATTAIQLEWNQWLVLGTIQLYALCAAPTWSISSTIVLARLANSQKEFGPIRAMATLGWMGGCLIISLMRADTTSMAGYTGAMTWLIVAGFTFLLPRLETPKSIQRLTLKQRLGLDALSLLKHRDHRVVFITCALFAIPLAGFYPYAPPHLRELGFERTSAWMSLGQVTEVIAMFALGKLLLKWRLKWIFVVGLSFGVVRFLVSALNVPWGLLAGIALHGCSFTLVFITAQIYLDQRVDPAWRARAQALMSLMNGGAGNLCGYLGTGAWFAACGGSGNPRWPLFWVGLAGTVLAVLAFFLSAYRGIGIIPSRLKKIPIKPPSPAPQSSPSSMPPGS